jgi:hypothetical protein
MYFPKGEPVMPTRPMTTTAQQLNAAQLAIA